MISCGKARGFLVEHVRGAASEAALLQLDQHLSACEACCHERARWETLSALKDWQPAPLGGAARERILKRLVEARPEARVERRAARPILMFAGAAAAVALLAAAWPRHHATRIATATPATASATAAAGQPVRFADADVVYRAGAVAKLSPQARTIDLSDGELDVSGRAPGLRVATKQYVFRFVEAHAAFAPTSVQVFAGQVWVYTLDGRELATVGAGESWPRQIAAPADAAPKPVTKVDAKPDLPKISAAAELAQARTALADGDAPLARRHLALALSAATNEHDRAEAELFGAESFLVEEKPARAVERYRHVAAAYARLPEGEAASFAAAQLMSESAGSLEGFRAYLDRYPEGRFAREARDRLAETAPQ
jgi:hypothetical protein